MANNINEKVQLPLWDLSSIYKGFDHRGYKDDKEKLNEKLKNLLDFVKSSSLKEISEIGKAVSIFADAESLYENLYSYCYASYSVETGSTRALKEINRLEKEKLKLLQAQAIFRKKFPFSPKEVEAMAGADEKSRDQYTLFLKETAILKKHQLSGKMEDLIEELLQPGANAWSRMQESISSELSVKWDKKTGEKKTVTELRSLAFDPDRDVRERAYNKEIKAWKSVEIPMAYALNGVKGFSVILNKRHKWKTALEKSAFQSRITEKTLKAMIKAIEKTLPSFHKYLNTKANIMGLNKLAFYDLFAPLSHDDNDTAESNTSSNWSFEKGKGFIIDTFSSFDFEMGNFAKECFEKKRIDAMPRKGKIGGAYCINFPIAKECRVMCNYNGSFSSVSTVAHELGHGWHTEVLKDESVIYQNYPMTLAETASIFSETLIFDTAIKQASGKEKISLMENFLQEATQVIVDILSRFYFEKAVFKNRREGELTPQEFSILMLDAQKKTYKKALDKDTYHQYMWAVKGHYYIPDLNFYNYPYAFGQLFGIALYKNWLSDKKGFPKRYKEILSESGKKTAVEITAQAGFDIETESFWLESLSYIQNMIEEFSNEAGTK